MSGPRRCAIAPELLTALLVVVCTGTGAADHAPDSPESRLRRKADFLKKIRSLHQKKLELAEAEAEYKSSR
ncbi:MAG: hypothetical protein WBX00_34265 [Isosphaeraceae bacterium]